MLDTADRFPRVNDWATVGSCAVNPSWNSTAGGLGVAIGSGMILLA
ncbi:uncharacterized protein METZ01_LOCUS498330, partial [marine metagenome]